MCEELMSKTNKTGRSKKTIGGQFVALPHSVLDSRGFAELSPTSIAIYIQVLRLYNGANNGLIAISCRYVADRLKISHMTVSRGLRELINCGLLRQEKASSFSQKRLAAEYRLTHVRCNKTNTPPTQEYKHYGQAMSSRNDCD